MEYKPHSREEAQFLKNYKPGDYARPSVTVDNVIWQSNQYSHELEILLVKRGNHPYKGYWALPGGFVQPDESAHEAAARELKEETGVSNAYLEQLYFVSTPGRDPRMWVMSAVYMGFVPQGTMVRGGDDAVEARWFNINQLGRGLKKGYFELAFDHADIFAQAVARLRNKAYYTNIIFHLMPETFTLDELQKVYESLYNQNLHKPNFRKRMVSRLEPTGQKTSEHSNRPAELYRLNPDYVVDKNLHKASIEELFDATTRETQDRV